MRLVSLKISVSAFTLAGCATVIDPSSRVVSQYQNFLDADNTVFAERVKRYLGLMAEQDILKKKVHEWVRLGPNRGAAISYGIATVTRIGAFTLTANLVVYFDSSVTCVTPKNLESLGTIRKGAPAYTSPHAPYDAPRRFNPDYIESKTKMGTVRLELGFNRNCLEKITQTVHMPAS